MTEKPEEVKLMLIANHLPQNTEEKHNLLCIGFNGEVVGKQVGGNLLPNLRR
jgi:hypothetical protein